MKTAIITVSTSVAAGRAEDRSGEALAELAEAAGAEIVAREVVADDRKAIEKVLRRHARDGAALIFTTGGTGFTHDDVTPEATRAVIDRDAPGFAEAMRAEAVKHTPMGILSRGVSGHRGPDADRQLPRQPEGDRRAVPGHRPDARARGGDAAARGWTNPRPLSCAAWSAASASGPCCGRCRLPFPPGRRWRCSGATARASRPCCGSWPRCCGRTPASVSCSARRCRGGHSPCAGGSGCWRTSRCCIAI